jgi:Type IX secretion system membrane protein PorP/SprF
MRKNFLILLHLLFTGLLTGAQDVHFSQFFEAPLWRNPSLAGIFTGDIRVQTVYRDQWNSVTNAYRTGSVNAEVKMPVGKNNDFVTMGMQVLQDRAGTIALTTTHVLPALNSAVNATVIFPLVSWEDGCNAGSTCRK